MGGRDRGVDMNVKEEYGTAERGSGTLASGEGCRI